MDTPNFPDGPYSKMHALKDTLNDKDVRKKVKRILVGTGALMVVSCAYVLHRKQINVLHLAHQDAAYETMWSSFDEGVKYGMTLAVNQTSDYAFGTVDNK